MRPLVAAPAVLLIALAAFAAPASAIEPSSCTIVNVVTYCIVDDHDGQECSTPSNHGASDTRVTIRVRIVGYASAGFEDACDGSEHAYAYEVSSAIAGQGVEISWAATESSAGSTCAIRLASPAATESVPCPGDVPPPDI